MYGAVQASQMEQTVLVLPWESTVILDIICQELRLHRRLQRVLSAAEMSEWVICSSMEAVLSAMLLYILAMGRLFMQVMQEMVLRYPVHITVSR